MLARHSLKDQNMILNVKKTFNSNQTLSSVWNINIWENSYLLPSHSLLLKITVKDMKCSTEWKTWDLTYKSIKKIIHQVQGPKLKSMEITNYKKQKMLYIITKNNFKFASQEQNTQRISINLGLTTKIPFQNAMKNNAS